jgi:hypothetical protein
LSDFNEPEFSRHFFESPQMSNFVKIRQVGAELFYAAERHRETDVTKLIVAFRNLGTCLKTTITIRVKHFCDQTVTWNELVSCMIWKKVEVLC